MRQKRVKNDLSQSNKFQQAFLEENNKKKYNKNSKNILIICDLSSELSEIIFVSELN